MDKRGKRAGPIAPFALLILLSAGVYIGGYIGLSTPQIAGAGDGKLLVLRSCKYEWLSVIYSPIAKMEHWTTGNYVLLVSEDVPAAVP